VHDEALSGTALDDAIARALAVEPSPGFAARVRGRIAEEPAPAGRSRFWMLAASAAASAALALAIAVVRTSPALAPSPAGLASRAVTWRAAVPGVAEPTAAFATAAAPVSNTRARRDVATASREPEILVDPREVRALRAFIDTAVRGAVDARALFDASEPRPVEDNPVQGLYIAPIELPPLSGDGKGVFQ
jgi:hypothetical protein